MCQLVYVQHVQFNIHYALNKYVLEFDFNFQDITTASVTTEFSTLEFTNVLLTPMKT